MEKSDSELIAEVLEGNTPSFEFLVIRYQPRLFATARCYARPESEVEDIVQEIFSKAFLKLSSFRGEAPFEHWLMRMAVRVCYDFLRTHQRSKETTVTDFHEEPDWLERHAGTETLDPSQADGARELVQQIMSQLAPAHQLIINLLEIEEKSMKEIAQLTGWSIPLVKVRAFRARAEMKKILSRMDHDKYL